MPARRLVRSGTGRAHLIRQSRGRPGSSRSWRMTGRGQNAHHPAESWPARPRRTAPAEAAALVHPGSAARRPAPSQASSASGSRRSGAPPGSAGHRLIASERGNLAGARQGAALPESAGHRLTARQNGRPRRPNCRHMPDLTHLASPPGMLSLLPALLLTVGRATLAAYATLATTLATACLVLQVLTRFDQRRASRHRPALPPAAAGDTTL